MSPTQSEHPNRKKLELFVRRANKALPTQAAGFLTCFIVTDEPPVVAYQFRGHMEAHQYLISTGTISSDFRIDDSNQSRVLQTVQLDKITR